MVTEAIILAGGLGTRLREAVPELPKAMAPVAGRPFLAYLMDFLQQNGIRRVVLAVGYRYQPIRQFFGSHYGGLDVTYSIEDEPLGTGGALQRALALVEGEFAFALNGDTFLRVDYKTFGAMAERRPRLQLGVALCRVADASRYGSVMVNQDRIEGFKARGFSGPGLINAGSYLVNRQILKTYRMPVKFSWEADLLQARVAELQPVAFECDGPFIDIGIPEALAEAQRLIPELVKAAA